MKTYQFGEKIYLMKPLVLGQLRKLTEILKTIKIEQPTQAGIIIAFGDKLPQALAVVLIEDNLPIKDAIEKYQERADELEYLLSPEDTLQVIEDFFLLTPVSSLIEKLSGMLKNLNQQISRISSIASPPETSATEN